MDQLSQSKFDLWQNIGTILALVISSLALFVSIYEANIMKSQQKAMVWPYLSVTQQYDNVGFELRAYNNGTGPAIIKSIQVDYKDHVMPNIDELLDSLIPNRSFGYDILTNNSMKNRVIKAGEEVTIFGFPWTEETRQVNQTLANARIRVQYESVLGEKWLYDTKDGSHREKKFKAAVEFKN